MKKQILFGAALFCATISQAQIQPMGNGMQPMGNGSSMPYTWTTDLYSVQSGIDANLGTASYDPLNFYTNGQKRVVIDANGNLQSFYPIRLGDDQNNIFMGYAPSGDNNPAVISYRSGSGDDGGFQGFKYKKPCYIFYPDHSSFPPMDYNYATITANIYQDMLQVQQQSQNSFLSMGLINNDGIIALESVAGISEGGSSEKLRINPSCKNDVEICEGGGLTKIFYDAYVGQNLKVNRNADVSGNLNVNSAFIVTGSTGKTVIGGQTQVGGNHANALLSVNGKIVGKEVVVTLSNWADYVFNKDYKLQSLEKVESYIKQNKHLPNVPTAKQIEENGADLGELVKVQMEKIEELTLYMIELKKESEALKAEMEVLKSKNLKGKSRK